MGRGPDWSLASDLDGSTWVEAVAVASKARLVLPVILRRRLGWAASQATVRLLGVIEPDGSAELMLWDRQGEVERGRLKTALERASEKERAGLAVAAADRYVRFGLEPDGRMTLPFNLAVHLGADADGLVRVVATGGRLWLWNEAEWRISRAVRFGPLLRAMATGP